MIHEVGAEVGAVLRSRACPIPIVDGPEATTTTTFARERIVIEHDEESSDDIVAAKGTYVNPVPAFIVNQAAKITIYAQAPAAGAKPFEHRRRAEHVRDMVLVALKEVAATRKNALTFQGGRFVQPVDLAKSESIGGAVYEMKFKIERGVRTLTWAGEKRPEATIGGVGGVDVVTNVLVATNGSNEEPV